VLLEWGVAGYVAPFLGNVVSWCRGYFQTSEYDDQYDRQDDKDAADRDPECSGSAGSRPSPFTAAGAADFDNLTPCATRERPPLGFGSDSNRLIEYRHTLSGLRPGGNAARSASIPGPETIGRRSPGCADYEVLYIVRLRISKTT